MNLHYSQTQLCEYFRGCLVLLPYEFTLLSNGIIAIFGYRNVLLPYEFTLLSNNNGLAELNERFYYLMNLHYSQTRFRQLRK